MQNILLLADMLKDEGLVYIQTHNFPDHDAVASAYALRFLLAQRGVSSALIHEGDIQRDSLLLLIGELNITIKHSSEYSITESDKIIIVDGCKGNKNVTDLIGDEVAVIDHHEIGPGAVPDDVQYRDIRPQYGACSTIIYSYYRDLDLEMPQTISTALMTGLLVDTALLTRGVSEEDVIAYSNLYRTSDIPFVNAVLRNNIQQKDLTFYKRALEKMRIQDRFAFCYFEDGCNQNLLGIIGDFFLSLNEVDFVLLCARNMNSINFSLRSEVRKWNAAMIIQDILKDIGFGGGHSDMAGGIIKDTKDFSEEEFFQKTLRTLKVTS